MLTEIYGFQPLLISERRNHKLKLFYIDYCYLYCLLTSLKILKNIIIKFKGFYLKIINPQFAIKSSQFLVLKIKKIKQNTIISSFQQTIL
jgi:hypothetical protein